MNFDLCIGNGEIFWEFADMFDRDQVWRQLIRSHGWKEEWAALEGDRHIVIHQDKIPILYRWKCGFDCQ